jgi:predicted phosphodiesterase
MELRDMGELAGPVLVFGGPYSNLPALRALLWKASTLGIGPEAMICTGDVVAYCAEPAECVALVRSEGIAVVAGNCERQLAAGAADCGCGFAAGTACDLLSAGWYPFADARIGADDRRWMAGLPDVVTFGHGGRRYAVIHGGVSDISRFVWSTSPDADLRAEIALVRDVAGRRPSTWSLARTVPGSTACPTRPRRPVRRWCAPVSPRAITTRW